MGLDPGDVSMGWDIESEFDPERSGWAEKVHTSIPRIEEDEMVLLRRLESKIDAGTKSKERELGGDSGADKAAGTGGDEVATEEEERGFVGPSKWAKERQEGS
jgi:hypothetical protein